MKAAVELFAVLASAAIVCQSEPVSDRKLSWEPKYTLALQLSARNSSAGRLAPEVVPVEQIKGRIISGEEADTCQFPHQVSLLLGGYQGYGFCGGSIIDSRWILTAAHCVEDVYRGITVYAGSNTRLQGIQRSSKRVFLHGDYANYHLRNDVALIELDSPLPLGSCIKAVELETEGCDSENLVDETAVVSGWGATENQGDLPLALRFTRTRVVSNEFCISHYTTNHVDRGTLCTKPFNENHLGSICGGDSGGALVRESTKKQVGVNSFTLKDDCTANTPHGYARVPCFIDWINYVMTL